MQTHLTTHSARGRHTHQTHQVACACLFKQLCLDAQYYMSVVSPSPKTMVCLLIATSLKPDIAKELACKQMLLLWCHIPDETFTSSCSIPWACNFGLVAWERRHDFEGFLAIWSGAMSNIRMSLSLRFNALASFSSLEFAPLAGFFNNGSPELVFLPNLRFGLEVSSDCFSLSSVGGRRSS